KRVEPVQLGLQEVAFRVDYIELAGEPVVVTDAREPERLAQCGDPRVLRCVRFACARLRDERFTHFPECKLHRLLILRDRLPLARVGRIDFRAQAARVKDRLSDTERELPYRCRAAEETAERR